MKHACLLPAQSVGLEIKNSAASFALTQRATADAAATRAPRGRFGPAAMYSSNGGVTHASTASCAVRQMCICGVLLAGAAGSSEAVRECEELAVPPDRAGGWDASTEVGTPRLGSSGAFAATTGVPLAAAAALCSSSCARARARALRARPCTASCATL